MQADVVVVDARDWVARPCASNHTSSRRQANMVKTDMFNQNTWSRRTEVVGKRQSTGQQVRSIFSTEAGGQPVL